MLNCFEFKYWFFKKNSTEKTAAHLQNICNNSVSWSAILLFFDTPCEISFLDPLSRPQDFLLKNVFTGCLPVLRNIKERMLSSHKTDIDKYPRYYYSTLKYKKNPDEPFGIINTWLLTAQGDPQIHANTAPLSAL